VIPGCRVSRLENEGHGDILEDTWTMSYLPEITRHQQPTCTVQYYEEAQSFSTDCVSALALVAMDDQVPRRHRVEVQSPTSPPMWQIDGNLKLVQGVYGRRKWFSGNAVYWKVCVCVSDLALAPKSQVPRGTTRRYRVRLRHPYGRCPCTCMDRCNHKSGTINEGGK
jgi:hypothetical protein